MGSLVIGALSNFLERLLGSGRLFATGVDGVYGKDAVFEAIVAGFESVVTKAGANDGAEVVRFPPVMPRAQLERSGYLNNFPSLAGTVHSFCGDEDDHQALLSRLRGGDDWTAGQAPTDVVLTPAACYPLYPMMGAQGLLPPGGRLFDIQSYCFRREPSRNPLRMQSFRQREYVRAGSSNDVRDFRAMWVNRGRLMIAALDLPFDIQPAADAFFGRAGRLMKARQREQELKLELAVPIGDGSPTACLSFNDHQDHFGQAWGIEQSNGETAHTACAGFGLERVALALLNHHGVDPALWPGRVRETLSL